MEEPVEVIPLPGFDPDGDPEIRRTAEGRLWLVFNFMPPSWVPEEECVDFGRELERAIGVPVFWEDREFFRIDQPGEGTVEAIRQFLATYRRRHDRSGSGA